MRSRLVPRGPPWRPNSWTVFFAGQQRGNRNSSLLHMRTLRYSLRRVSPLDSVNGGLITQRSVVQIHPPQPTGLVAKKVANPFSLLWVVSSVNHRLLS